MFDGNAQELDHILITQNLTGFDRATGRNDADFPEILRGDPNGPQRISDHDMIVGLLCDQAAAGVHGGNANGDEPLADPTTGWCRWGSRGVTDPDGGVPTITIMSISRMS